MKKNKRVLVTGATGFIGRETVTSLLDAGWHVTSGTRNESKQTQSEFVYLDLSEPKTLLALEDGLRFDAIVHLGARVALTDETESGLFVENVLSTGCLVYLANLWDAQLIFSSSAIVHGASTEVIKSDSELCPDTPYAKSKLLSEQLLFASNVNHCIFRIAGVFGANGPAHLSLNRAIIAARKGELINQIGSGTALRNYIYVKDVAAAVVYALDKNLQGTHLLAGNEVLSVSEMLQAICKTFTLGQSPLRKDGPEATNQVVTPSSYLPKTRNFLDALSDIQEINNK